MGISTIGSKTDRRAFLRGRFGFVNKEGVCSSSAAGMGSVVWEARNSFASAEFLGTSFSTEWTFPAKLYVCLIIIMAPAPSLNVVLGDLESLLRVGPCLFSPGLEEFRVSMAWLSSVDGCSAFLSLGLGLPVIMLSHNASTSTVAAAVFTSGFFSTFLR